MNIACGRLPRHDVERPPLFNTDSIAGHTTSVLPEPQAAHTNSLDRPQLTNSCTRFAARLWAWVS